MKAIDVQLFGYSDRQSNESDMSVFEREVWNKAIEAAAELAKEYDCYHAIQGLKEMIDDSLSDTQYKYMYLDCILKCYDGKAPSEDTVAIMLKHLKAHHEAKYPSLKLIKQTEYWINGLGSDITFAIFWRLG